MLRKLALSAVCAASVLFSGTGMTNAADAEFTLRLPNVDPPYTTVGELKYPNHVYGMMRTFKDALEGCRVVGLPSNFTPTAHSEICART